VQACRYCGLLEPSIAAYEQARRVDPSVRTSVCYSYYMLGDFDRAIETEHDEARWLTAYAFAAKGQVEEANQIYLKTRDRVTSAQGIALFDSQLGALAGDRDKALTALSVLSNSSFHDPEGLYFATRTYAYIRATGEALRLLRRVVEGGYYQPAKMTHDPWLDSLRAEPEFIRLLRLAEAKRREAVAAYLEHGGDRILGVSPAA
jgi:hypothetical protein